jgi:hypothetical protein
VRFYRLRHVGAKDAGVALQELDQRASRALRVAVIGERVGGRRRVARLLAAARDLRHDIVFAGHAAEFSIDKAAAGIELAIVSTGKRSRGRFDALVAAWSRSMAVLVIADGGGLAEPDVTRGRTFAILESGGLTASSLELAVANALRTRASEDRLLRMLADQASELTRLERANGALIDAAESAATAARRLCNLLDLRERESQLERASALARESIDGLAVVQLDSEAARKRRRKSREPAELNAIVSEAMQSDANRRGAEDEVSGMLSEHPVYANCEPGAARALVEQAIAAWRRQRQAGDRLEMITWDAGHEARIALVSTQRAIVSLAPPDRLAPFKALDMRSVHAAIRGAVVACGGDVRITGGAAPSSLTICLPKMLRDKAQPRQERLWSIVG